MRASTTSFFNIKSLGLTLLSVALSVILVVSWLATAVNASGVVGVTSNIADVPGGDNLVLTVTIEDDGDVERLEVDHSFEPALPSFHVYTDEVDPYGGGEAQFVSAGVDVIYSEANSQWVIDFGSAVTDVFRDTGNVSFYLALDGAAGDGTNDKIWGGMHPPTAENTFSFNLVDGTGDSLVPEVVEEDEPIVPGVPNTSLGR